LGLISLKPRVLNELGISIPKPRALGTASNFKPKNPLDFWGLKIQRIFLQTKIAGLKICDKYSVLLA